MPQIKVLVRLHSPLKFRVLFEVHVDGGEIESLLAARGVYS